MDKQTGNDRTRTDRDESYDDQRQRPAGPAGRETDTASRDSDLQQEGNLGNERNRNSPADEEEDSQLGNRGGFTR
ncbi:MAG: hypothetical protein HOQ29_09370 [Acidobacteria bacterium]|nr:hypothetical protein [Acidobacteriota bacterium]